MKRNLSPPLFCVCPYRVFIHRFIQKKKNQNNIRLLILWIFPRLTEHKKTISLRVDFYSTGPTHVFFKDQKPFYNVKLSQSVSNLII